MKLSGNNNSIKHWSPRLMFLNEKTIRKIQIILEIEMNDDEKWFIPKNFIQKRTKVKLKRFEWQNKWAWGIFVEKWYLLMHWKRKIFNSSHAWSRKASDERVWAVYTLQRGPILFEIVQKLSCPLLCQLSFNQSKMIASRSKMVLDQFNFYLSEENCIKLRREMPYHSGTWTENN